MILEHNKDLQNYNTMNVGVKADAFLEIGEEQDIIAFFSKPFDDFYVLGGGSNVLFCDDFKGTILKMNMKGIEERSHLNDDFVEITAFAGENWHELVMYSLSKNYGGIENLSLIPGTVGACPIQNIGAYGVEVKDVISGVYGYDIEEKKFRTFTNEECKFGYRDSVFKQELKGRFIITKVKFRLTKKNHQKKISYGAILETLKSKGIEEPSIQQISEAVVRIRNQKLPNPLEEPNTGSFFKNPIVAEFEFLKIQKDFPEMPFYQVENGVKIPAGWLIEQTGWKGKKEDGVGVHPRQALVIVNYEGKSGKEIYDFSSKIISDVKDRFGIELEREVNVVI